jgi:hypothetical protein
MKKPLLVIFLLCFSGLTALAQDSTHFHPSTFIKVNPTTFINELDISIEQELTEKLSLEVGISGIYTDYPDYLLSKKVDIGQKKPNISTEQFVDGRGLGFRAGLRWYLFSPKDVIPHANGTYFEPVLLFKRVFYPNEPIVLNDVKYKSSANKDVYGLQLLIGRQIVNKWYVIDPYIGVGVRTKVYQYRNFSENSSGVVHNDGKLVSVLPSLQLGIKLGLKL